MPNDCNTLNSEGKNMLDNPISEADKTSRQKAIQFAIDNNRLEGIETTAEMLKLSNEWINGHITFNAFKEKMYEVHGI
ncbi:antitoxin VbhA family protein [Testudinibacter sp. P80/BLE/0925]|uniref:antitoxin VbhA family protein n=1 Tax=Testudinibacter sp. TW-1 TaxID=3417757 RepID=UPI003D369E71